MAIRIETKMYGKRSCWLQTMWSTGMTHAKQPFSISWFQNDYSWKLVSSTFPAKAKYFFRCKHGSCDSQTAMNMDSWNMDTRNSRPAREFPLTNMSNIETRKFVNGDGCRMKPLLLVKKELSQEIATFFAQNGLSYKKKLRNKYKLLSQEGNISISVGELATSLLSDDESESGDDSYSSDSDTDSSVSTSDEEDLSDSDDEYYSYDEGISDDDSEEDYLYSDEEEGITSESDDGDDS
ncbi:hypothetical protein GpartN1_g5360.t1 [Galdieria partita]|uniref:Uncharacterized protein n=1 Tax=Galdieria partita TaxID=83374 RepID=A0A9C7US00_9RHOD|nr:hypothetical protein GpartN1_g5360.t1 [Galdieria partita]